MYYNILYARFIEIANGEILDQRKDPIMKRTLTLLLLLAAVLLCGVACKADPAANKIPVQGDTTAKQEAETLPPKTEGDHLLSGKWYGKSAALVFQFFTDKTMKLYQLTPGYYEYDSLSDGTYTYDGTMLIYTLTGEEPVSLYCTATADSLTINSYYSFTIVDELPSEHIVYKYPDLEKLAQDDPLTDDEVYIGHTIPTTLRAEALERIRSEYWDNKPEDEMTLLEDGVAESGDLVNIDYTGYLDGVPFDNGADVNVRLILSENSGMIPGFADGIVGHAVGAEFEVPVTFPENYQATHLAGKAVIFKMKLNGIYDRTMTDAIAQENNYDSLDTWIEAEYTELLENKIWELIPMITACNYPTELYDAYYQQISDFYHRYAFEYLGGDFEQLLELLELTEEDLVNEATDYAGIAFNAVRIVQKYGLLSNDEAVEAFKKEYMKDYSGMSEDEILEYIEGEGKNYYYAELCKSLAADYLMEQNTFTDENA